MQDIAKITAELSRLTFEAWLFVVICVVLALAFAWLIWNGLRNRGRLQRVLRKLGCEFRHDHVIPDGVGGQIHLDYLLLTAKGLVVLDVKNYRGILFGAEHIPVWTQMVRGGSYKFTNPLPQNALRVQAVKLLVADVPVRGRVVFTQEGHFTKGWPAGVSLLESLQQDLGLTVPPDTVPAAYRDAWAYLLAQGESAEGEARPSRQSA